MRVQQMMTSAAMWLAAGRPAGAERSSADESIRRALLAQLRSQGLWNPLRCEVAVRDGIVKIAGICTTAQERIATRAAAEAIPGVRGLRDVRSYWVPEGGYD